MTIAELQLGRMRPLPVETHTLAGLERARRGRRRNLAAMLAIWAAFWLHAVGAIVAAGDLASALDRFLPLQLVAALVAMAVYFGGRSLHPGGWMRRLTLVPAAVTAIGAFAVVWSLTLGSSVAYSGSRSAGWPGDGPQAVPPFPVQLVSL